MRDLGTRLTRLERDMAAQAMPVVLWRLEHDTDEQVKARWRAHNPSQPEPQFQINVIRHIIVEPPPRIGASNEKP